MLCRTVVTVTIAHAPPIPATFVAAASWPPFVLTKSTVTVLVEVDVVVRVVVGSFDAIGVTAKFAGAAGVIGPAAAAVALCMYIVLVTVKLLVMWIVVVMTVAVEPIPCVKVSVAALTNVEMEVDVVLVMGEVSTANALVRDGEFMLEL